MNSNDTKKQLLALYPATNYHSIASNAFFWCGNGCMDIDDAVRVLPSVALKIICSQ
jgi:hypothetical protein